MKSLQPSYGDIWSVQSTLSQSQLNRSTPAFIPRSTTNDSDTSQQNRYYNGNETNTPPQRTQSFNSQSQPTYNTNIPPQSYNADLAGTVQNVNDIIGLKLPQFEAKYYVNEHVQHLYNMFNYRVRMCDSYLNTGQCMYDSVQCYDAHSYEQLRRIPRILAYSNGHFFSYNACRCQQYELEGNCDKGNDCRYSHSKDEIGIHPSRYKTQSCSFATDEQGHCTRFGANCAFAHGSDDLRQPIVLKQGTPHKLHTKSMDTMKQIQSTNTESIINNSNNNNNKMQLNDYVCPVEELDEEREFYLYHFKTQPCSILDPNPSSLCAKDLCAGYHEPKKKRRTPALFQYSSEPCPNVKSSAGVWLDPAQCYNGDQCPKAHTLFEVIYHPKTYRTVLCSNFDINDPSKWNCKFLRACSHAHAKHELRPLQQSPVAPTRTLNLPNSPVAGISTNVSIDSLLDSPDTTKRKLLTRNVRSSSMAATTDATVRTPQSSASGIGPSCWSPLGLHSTSPDASITSPASPVIGRSTSQQVIPPLSPLLRSESAVRPPIQRTPSNLRIETSNIIQQSPNKPTNWSLHTPDNIPVKNTNTTQPIPRDRSYDEADELDLIESTKYRINTPSPDPYFASSARIQPNIQYKLDELYSEIQELKQLLKQEKQSRNSIERQYVELQNSYKSLQDKYIRAQQSLHTAIEQKHDIKSHQSTAAELEKLQTHVQLLQKQLDDVNSERTTQCATIDRLNQERSVICRDNLKLQIELDELKKQVKSTDIHSEHKSN